MRQQAELSPTWRFNMDGVDSGLGALEDMLGHARREGLPALTRYLSALRVSMFGVDGGVQLFGNSDFARPMVRERRDCAAVVAEFLDKGQDDVLGKSAEILREAIRNADADPELALDGNACAPRGSARLSLRLSAWTRP